MRDKIDLLPKVVEFHENCESLDHELRDTINSLSVNIIDHTKDMFNVFFQQNLIDHFNIEEMVIFPAVKAWAQNDTYDKLINDYLIEHKKLITEGKNILDTLTSNDIAFSKDDLLAMVREFADLNYRICAHSRHEDIHIVPLLKENTTIRFICGRRMLEYQNLVLKNTAYQNPLQP